MDCSTGKIYQGTESEIRKFADTLGRPLAPVSRKQFEELEPLGDTVRKNYMRNQPCVCGSHKKFKGCCWSKYV